MITPSVVKYTILLGFYARMNDQESINQCLSEINDKKLVLDLPAYALLINFYISQNNTKEVCLLLLLLFF
jgi:hypothetical protein